MGSDLDSMAGADAGEQPAGRVAIASAGVDDEIYSLLTLIVRAHVYPWYHAAISRDPDRDFARAITATLAHTLHEIKRRVQLDDCRALIELITVDVPSVLAQHVHDLDDARAKAGSACAHNTTPEAMYHSLAPHIAVSVDSTGAPVVDALYLRTLTDQVLARVMPARDYGAQAARTIAQELVANVVLGAVFTTLSQPYFLHQLLLRLLEDHATRSHATQSSTRQSLADLCAAFLSSALSLLLVAVAALRFVAASLATPIGRSRNLVDPIHCLLQAWTARKSSLVARSLDLASLVTSLAPALADRAAVHLLREHLMQDRVVIATVRLLKAALFPGGQPPEARLPPPSPDEQDALRERCEHALANALPPLVVCVMMPGSHNADAPLMLARELLRPISCRVANVHAYLFLLDTLISRLFPDMCGKEVI